MGTLEKKYQDLVGAGKKEDAIAAFRLVSSAFDKAAKTGVLPKARAVIVYLSEVQPSSQMGDRDPAPLDEVFATAFLS